MPKMRTLKVVGEDYTRTAPIHDSLTQSIPASAAATFRCLEDGDAWGEWIGAIKGVTWTSPKPFGVGTTRTVTVGGGSIEEEFVAWEDGRRMSFYFSASTLPVFAAFAEDYVLESTGDDSCVLHWSWGLEGASVFKYLQGLVNAGFKRQGVGSLKNLATYMADNRDRYAV